MVAPAGCFVTRPGRGGGDGHGYRDTHSGPTTPLRHQSRSMANVSCVYGTARGAPECSADGEGGTSAVRGPGRGTAVPCPYSGRASSWWFRGTTCTNASTDSRSGD